MIRRNQLIALGVLALIAGTAFAVLGPNSNDTALSPSVNYTYLEGDGTQALTVDVINSSTDGSSLQQHTAYFVGGGSATAVLTPGMNHIFVGMITSIDCLEVNSPSSSTCDWFVH